MTADSPEGRHARKAALIAGIAAGKTVIVAAAEAGIGWRRAYVWRAEDAAFRAAWDKARAQIKARVPPALVVPEPPDPPAALPAFTVPPSPPLPPEEPEIQIRILKFHPDGTWNYDDDPPGSAPRPPRETETW